LDASHITGNRDAESRFRHLPYCTRSENPLSLNELQVFQGRLAMLGFVAAHGNSFEALQLADHLLNSGSGLVEKYWKETVACSSHSRESENDRNNVTTTAIRAVGC
jgi:hypothetical protein